MSNFVYSMVSEALARVVSERAADHMLRAALHDSGLTPDDVTAEEMQRVIVGPLQQRLIAVMPPARASAELTLLASRLQASYPKAPTLFPEASGPVWDDATLQSASSAPMSSAPVEASATPTPATSDDEVDEEFEFDLDDFLLDDPEDAGGGKSYVLSHPSGQDELLSDLARFEGVVGVVVCDHTGKVVRSRVPRGSDTLARLVAHLPVITADRPTRLICADLGAHTVCVKTLDVHLVGVLASGSTNLGRLIVELSALKETV
ncbi:roadblock/LC7 domain-containing protein [Deinococcus yavapaiensis]|uniref:Roadblock/LC7 domain-containing protein n=1 Tax=Deinococcus yavapaiensis KR-236 TaxID=694435 RepID=A0A318SFQ1_9DEIO|nr:roadblock/LC7 domain-containing protein [Deinococcus yavapaiensis]PYE55696.1 hypothetical protein DES52_10259 [Deinococcus yavapaiensis KR-236]